MQESSGVFQLLSLPTRPPVTSDDNDDEETPFLGVRSDDTPHKPTPLPAAQISALLLPWIAEATISQSISPYINQVCVLVV